MTRDEERLYEHVANAKLIHLNEQLIFPLLQQKAEERLASLCEAFKAGGEVRLADVAYIAAIRDIKIELEAKARGGDRAAARLNLHPDL